MCRFPLCCAHPHGSGVRTGCGCCSDRVGRVCCARKLFRPPPHLPYHGPGTSVPETGESGPFRATSEGSVVSGDGDGWQGSSSNGRTYQGSYAIGKRVTGCRREPVSVFLRLCLRVPLCAVVCRCVPLCAVVCRCVPLCAVVWRFVAVLVCMCLRQALGGEGSVLHGRGSPTRPYRKRVPPRHRQAGNSEAASRAWQMDARVDHRWRQRRCRRWFPCLRTAC
jgi:hypothetical protein